MLRLALAGFDRMIGLGLADLSVDGGITLVSGGGEVAGRSPVDRGEQGTKRPVACDGGGIPPHLAAARADDHDSPLGEPTLAAVCDMTVPLPEFPGMHLDRGYHSTTTRDLLETLGYHGHIAAEGVPAPIQAGRRRPGRRDSWLNGYGKPRRPHPLPLAHQTHHPPPPQTLICRTL